MNSSLFFLAITALTNYSLAKIQISTQTVSLIKSQLQSDFFKSNINDASPEQFNLSLKIFQEKMLKIRNFKCADFEELTMQNIARQNYSKWTQIKKALIQINDNTNVNQNIKTILKGFDDMCIDSSTLIDTFKPNGDENQDTVYRSLFDIILTQYTNKGCDLCKEEIVDNSITKLETWCYGLLFVTIISTSSLCGAFVIPLNNKKFYKKILMVLIGIAVGSLAGSGFLHLIPQAFGIADDIKYSKNHEYVWKSVVMMSGVYLFYLVEKILKIMILRKKIKKSSSKTANSDNSKPAILESIGFVKTHDATVEPNVEMRVHLNEKILMQNSFQNKNQHGHSHNIEDLHTVAPVAWMIIFGDGLHNFIDGLSIGAAFTESILKGVSICLAVICEEFPHELGDFAILLNAGMSYRAALFFNFLSACSCYAGLVVGIILGDNFSANKWIYAIAGGMFLYISLCDMVPELNEIGDEIERDYLLEKRKMLFDQEKYSEEEINLDNPGSIDLPEVFDLSIKIKVLLMQHLGILLGFSVMLIMAMKSDGLIPE